MVKNAKKLEPKVYPVPADIDQYIARLKLESMGISRKRSVLSLTAAWVRTRTRNEENGNCGLAKDPVSHAPPQDSLARTTPMRRHDDEVSALGVDDLENRISRLGI